MELTQNTIFILRIINFIFRKQLSTGEELFFIDRDRFICKDDFNNIKAQGKKDFNNIKAQGKNDFNNIKAHGKKDSNNIKTQGKKEFNNKIQYKKIIFFITD